MRPTSRQQSPSQSTAIDDALIRLEELAALLFTGSDAPGFLQGYLTSDTTQLGSEPQFTALCNIKGRVVCTGYAWLDDDAVVLALHHSLCAVVSDFLRPYLAFSRTKATAAPLRVVGYLGPNPPPGELRAASGGRIDDDRHLFVLPDSTQETPARTMQAGLRRWLGALIERQEVLLEDKTSARFLPQMLGLVERGAVSFSKGCYLGQEVVARAQHRGAVKRKIRALKWLGEPPVVGDAIGANGRELGTVVLCSPKTGETGQVLAVMVQDRPGPFASRQTNTKFQAL